MNRGYTSHEYDGRLESKIYCFNIEVRVFESRRIERARRGRTGGIVAGIAAGFVIIALFRYVWILRRKFVANLAFINLDDGVR